MKIKYFLIITALFFTPPALFAQQAKGAGAEASEEETEDDSYIRRGDGWAGRFSAYTKGDKTFSISLGTVFPLFFVMNNGDIISGYGEGEKDVHISIGGTGSLSYTQFLNSHIFLGGEIQGSFAGTLAQKLVCFIPIGIKGGYQWTIGRFDFPLSLLAGVEAHTYSVSGDMAYWGFFLRPQVSVFFRFNHDWSFGLNAGWWWVPEWTKDPSKNVDGHFMDIMLTARYHF